jgi:D-threo-aldose 1-dehydrogenase
MNPFATIKFGGAAVGRLGMGGAPLGNLFAPIPEDVALATIERAWALGVRHFDTAPYYGMGLSEHRFGQILRARKRDEFVLSTKVGRLLSAQPVAPYEQFSFFDTLPFVHRFDYSHDGALRSIEDSLQRLGLGRIDIVYIHDCAADTHGPEVGPKMFKAAMDGAYRALERLRGEGVIKAIGLGVNDWRVCVEALKHGDFDGFLLAGRYTLIDHTAVPELLPLCVKRGARLVIGGPYNSGILAMGAKPGATFNYQPAPPDIMARVAKIEALCARHGVPLRAAALQFPLAHPAVASIIPGAREPGHVEENVALLSAAIPAAFWQALRGEGLLPQDLPVPTP